MNRFATSSEPGGTRRPAPPLRPDALAPAPTPPSAVLLYRSVTRLLKGIAGLDAYDRYLAHRESTHPDEPLLDEAEFWRCRWDADEKNPKARCC